MERRIQRKAAMAAAAATLIGLAGAARAQSPQQRQQDYEQQRRQNLERQFERQQRQMQWQQQRMRDQQDQQPFGQQPMDPEFIDPQMIVVVGVDIDQDGQSDAMYFVPGEVVRRLAREHRDQQQAGMGSMQLRPWARLQQTAVRDEGDFEDLPLSGAPGRMRQAQLSGTITETRTAQLIGQSEPSKLAKVRLNDGSTVFADLGPAQNFRDVQLARGDQVSISGSPVWINNQPVIFASRVQTEEGVIPVRRQQAGGQAFRQQDQWSPRQQQDQWSQRQQQDQWSRQQPRRQDQFERPQGWREQQPSRQPRFQTGLMQQQEPIHISGTITAADEVTIGDSDPYTFVKLRDDSGATGWVSLGPSRNLEDLDLRRNDRIEVLAFPVELQGATVYYANQLRTDGQTMRLSQKEGGQGARIQPAGMGQLQQVSGTIVKKTEITIGDSDPYTFVEVRDDDGKTQWVNLGPSDQVEDLDLSRNDRISVLATETDIHGETIFHAQQVSANGQTVNIQQAGHR